MTIATEPWFRGSWQMVRIIETVAGGAIGEFWGTCSFSPDGAGLICREQGVLRHRSTDYHSSRVSLWRFPGPGRIEVRYADGRPFHDFQADKAQATHLCGADRYRVSYDFGPENATDTWHTRWAVTGPAKDYVMTTRYRRLSGQLVTKYSPDRRKSARFRK